MNGHPLSQTTNYPPDHMAGRMRENGEQHAVNLEVLKSRESNRISTAEDVKALLEAEFRGIAEIQQSKKLSEEEFKLIENLYWHRMGQNPDGRTFYAGEKNVGSLEGRPDESASMSRLPQQYSNRTYLKSDYPHGSNSLRHETKLKRHVLEEVVLEDSDKFYERTLPKKTKKISKVNEKCLSSGELRNQYYNEETFPPQNSQRNIHLDQTVSRDQHLLPTAKPHHGTKHQSEIVLGDTLRHGINTNVETNRGYMLNKENVSTLPNEYNYKVYANNQENQNEMLVEDVQVFRDKNFVNAPLKLRNNFENEFEKSAIDKEKHRKSRLEGTESKIHSNPKTYQDEIILDDKLLIEESQHFSIKKSHKKPSFIAKVTAPKFKNKFRKSKRSSKNKARLDYSEMIHNEPILLSSRKTQEEIVLENLDTFSETTLTKKTNLAPTSSLEKSQKKLKSIEQELYTQSQSRFQLIEHNGPQREIYLSGQEIVSETTLKRPKKYKFKKSPNFNSEVTNLSTQILEAENKQNLEDSSVVLTKVSHNEPNSTFETNKEIELSTNTGGIDVNGLYVEENKRKSCKKNKSKKSNSGKSKSKKPLFKKRKTTSEIVIEDSEIFEDHNKPKKIHFEHGGVVRMAELDDMELPEMDEEEKEAEKEKNKKKNKKKFNKTKKQGETVIDKSFVYEDANNIGLQSTSSAHKTPLNDSVTEAKVKTIQTKERDIVLSGKETGIEVHMPTDDTSSLQKESLKLENEFKPNINILHIQGEQIVNENYFVADDTKLKFKSNRNSKSEIEDQKKMENKEKKEKDEKSQKFKIKLPDLNFRKKSKASDSQEVTSTSSSNVMKNDHTQEIDYESHANIDNTHGVISMHTKQKKIEDNVEVSYNTDATEVKDENKKDEFKFTMPNIHILKPTFSSKNVDGKKEIVNSDKTVTLTNEIKVNDTIFETNLPGKKTSAENRETKIQEKEVISYEKDTDIGKQVNLPNINIQNESTTSKVVNIEHPSSDKDVMKTSKVEKNEVSKPKDEVVVQAQQEEVVNDTMAVLDQTTENKKRDRSADKKFKFNFPTINISKPHFGKKNKEKQKEESVIKSEDKIVEENNQNKISTSSQKKQIEIPDLEILKKNKNVKDEEKISNLKKNEKEKAVKVTVPEVSVIEPQLPNTPILLSFRKPEIIEVSPNKIIIEEKKVISSDKDVIQSDHLPSLDDTKVDVCLPEVNIATENLNMKMSTKEVTPVQLPNIEVTEKQFEKTGKDEILTLNTSHSSVKTDREDVVVVADEEINETKKENIDKDVKKNDKKFKFNFPHFNISKPNFNLKKNKDKKNENKDLKTPEDIVVILSPDSQNETVSKISEREQDKNIVLTESQKEKKDFEIILPDVNILHSSLPETALPSTSSSTEVYKLEDDVFVEENKAFVKENIEDVLPKAINIPKKDDVTVHENINSPRAPQTDVNFKLISDSVNPTVKVNETIQKNNAEPETHFNIKTTHPAPEPPAIEKNTEIISCEDKNMSESYHEKSENEGVDVNNGENMAKVDLNKDKKVADKKSKFNFRNIHFGKKNKEESTNKKMKENRKIVEENKTIDADEVILPNVEIKVSEPEIKGLSKGYKDNKDADKPEKNGVVTPPFSELTEFKVPNIEPVNIDLRKSEEIEVPHTNEKSEETTIHPRDLNSNIREVNFPQIPMGTTVDKSENMKNVTIEEAKNKIVEGKLPEDKTIDINLPQVDLPKLDEIVEQIESVGIPATQTEVEISDSKVETGIIEGTKTDVDLNKNKSKKSGFSHFSLPKPNFKLGFKSKKEKNVEPSKANNDETKSTSMKSSLECKDPQKATNDTLVEDSTVVFPKSEKSVDVQMETITKPCLDLQKEDKEQTQKGFVDETIPNVEKVVVKIPDSLEESTDQLKSKSVTIKNEGIPSLDKNNKENLQIETKTVDVPVTINVSEKNEADTESTLNTKTFLEKSTISNIDTDCKSKQDINIENLKTENQLNEDVHKDISLNDVVETTVATEKTDTLLKTVEDDTISTLEKEKGIMVTEKPSFIGKLKSNLPQICIQKSDSKNEGSGCLGKRNQEKVEVTSKTVVAESVSDKSKQETKIVKEVSTENTLEKKKKKNLMEKFHLKKSQKEVVINDTHLYTDDSTLGRKKKDNVFILENDLSEQSQKKKFGKGKNTKPSQDVPKKEKQGEMVVVGDTLVTEASSLSKNGELQETEKIQDGRLSAFLEETNKEGTTGKALPKAEEDASQNKIILDANNKPEFNQTNVLKKDKSVENVQIVTDTDKKTLVVDNAGNEVLKNESLQESIQTPVKPTNESVVCDHEHTIVDSKNPKWNQSPNKKSAFFSTVPAATSCLDDRKPLQFVVVAIDFGTTFSGYAFSFNRDIESIHVMRKWEGGDPGVTNQKTPTTLLLDPNGQFHSFGFTARDFYHDLSPKEAQKWMYFEKFKMALHYNADLSSETEIRAANGSNFKALHVFSYALKFFRNHAIQEIGEQSNTPIYEEDIKWVITVPAIWKSPAKQFMREAAYKAGIASAEKSDRLLIALEPEAASVFVRKQRLKQLIPESSDDRKDSRSVNRSIQEFTPPEHVDNITYSNNCDDVSSQNQSLSSAVLNQSFQRCPSPTSFNVTVGQEVDITDNRFMVADCGGGTADITVYEMLSSTGGKLKELHKATGGPYGSIGVDLEFEKLLISVFDADYIEAFKAKRPAGWVDLMMAFESRKRAANPFKSKPLNVPLPFSFIDYHKKFKNSSVEAIIKKYNNKNVLWSSQGMLRLLPEAMDKLFQPTLDAIVKAIKEVISQPDVAGVNNIFMVGGFSESPMLQQEIRKNFANQSRILIPNDVSLTILKGAVLFGIDPSVVVIRKSRLTYGLGVLNRFIEGKHPEAKKAMKESEAWCVDVFDPLVLADQSVALGSSVIRSYTPASISQKFSLFHIYCSEDRNVDFVTEEGVAKCGTLRLDLDDHQWELESSPSRTVSQQIPSPEMESSEEGSARREIQARLTFGDTEIKLIALDVVTGNYVRATLDFLNK